LQAALTAVAQHATALKMMEQCRFSEGQLVRIEIKRNHAARQLIGTVPHARPEIRAKHAHIVGEVLHFAGAQARRLE